jgi:acetyltransferase-like isoleucine patch superfamily enzyme
MTARGALAHDWFPRRLPENIDIGERTWIYSSFAFLHYRSQQPCGLRIGNDSGIYNGSFLELGPEGQVEIGDFCTIVGAIISCNTRIVIGDYTLIAHEVVIADRRAPVPPGEKEVGSVAPYDLNSEPTISIGANTWIGTRAVLLGGTRIGEGAIVGAAAVVDFHVPAYTIVAGNPATVVSKIRG